MAGVNANAGKSTGAKFVTPKPSAKKISADREKAIAKAMAEFDKIDIKKNNVIDREELTLMVQKTFTVSENNESALEAQVNHLFQTFDYNNDGVISKEEWITFFTEVFDKA